MNRLSGRGKSEEKERAKKKKTRTNGENERREGCKGRKGRGKGESLIKVVQRLIKVDKGCPQMVVHRLSTDAQASYRLRRPVLFPSPARSGSRARFIFALFPHCRACSQASVRTRVRTAPPFVAAHTFCASRDIRVSFKEFALQYNNIFARFKSMWKKKILIARTIRMQKENHTFFRDH